MTRTSEYDATYRELQRRTWRPVDGRCAVHPAQPFRDCRECLAELAVIAEREREAERAAATERQAELLGAAERINEQFPTRYRDALTDRADVSDWVEHFRTSPATCPSLLLLGPTGTGKTHQAYGAIRGCVHTLWTTRAGRQRIPTWAAVPYTDFCASMRPGGPVDPQVEMQRLLGVDLLMVDDLGAAKHSEWVEENTYRLINGRYEDAKPLIVTTNLAMPEFRETIGDRIASRLAEMCTRVVLDGPDRRRARHRSEP